jgi:hypothetical protein
LRGDDVIAAVQKEFLYEDANPVIILHDDQHSALLLKSAMVKRYHMGGIGQPFATGDGWNLSG